jgi:hypothetical protein
MAIVGIKNGKRSTYTANTSSTRSLIIRADYLSVSASDFFFYCQPLDETSAGKTDRISIKFVGRFSFAAEVLALQSDNLTFSATGFLNVLNAIL